MRFEIEKLSAPLAEELSALVNVKKHQSPPIFNRRFPSQLYERLRLLALSLVKASRLLYFGCAHTEFPPMHR